MVQVNSLLKPVFKLVNFKEYQNRFKKCCTVFNFKDMERFLSKGFNFSCQPQ